MQAWRNSHLQTMLMVLAEAAVVLLLCTMTV
jgi:hypothetical protein